MAQPLRDRRSSGGAARGGLNGVRAIMTIVPAADRGGLRLYWLVRKRYPMKSNSAAVGLRKKSQMAPTVATVLIHPLA